MGRSSFWQKKLQTIDGCSYAVSTGRQNSGIIASMNHGPPRTPKGTRWGGRQKGTPNKLTGGVKDALRTAFTEAGGVEYLVGVAKSDPRVFCALLAKLLHSKGELPSGGVDAEVEALSDEALSARLALALREFRPQVKE